jgi:hypothetical protein
VHWLCSTPLSRFYTHPDRHCTRSPYAFKLEQKVLTHPLLPPLLPRSNIFYLPCGHRRLHLHCSSFETILPRIEERAGGGFFLYTPSHMMCHFIVRHPPPLFRPTTSTPPSAPPLPTGARTTATSLHCQQASPTSPSHRRCIHARRH